MERFILKTKNLTVGTKGIYYWNSDSCCAEIVYVGQIHNNAQILIIKKNNAIWDKDNNGNILQISYSACWKIKNRFYCLGLPTDQTDIFNLKSTI